MSYHISFDLHGVLDTYSEKMKPVLPRLIKKGIDVSILSGAFQKDILKECEILGYQPGIHYTKPPISILDYGVHQLKLPTWEAVSPRTGKKGTYFNDDLWWAMKAILCDIHQINILFDDKVRYRTYFGSEHITIFYLFNESNLNSVISYLENEL